MMPTALRGLLARAAVPRPRAASPLRFVFGEAEIAASPARQPSSGTVMANVAVLAKFVRDGDCGAVGGVIHGRLGLRPGDERPHANVADVTDLTSETGEILRGRPFAPVGADFGLVADPRNANPSNFRGGQQGTPTNIPRARSANGSAPCQDVAGYSQESFLEDEAAALLRGG